MRKCISLFCFTVLVFTALFSQEKSVCFLTVKLQKVASQATKQYGVNWNSHGLYSHPLLKNHKVRVSCNNGCITNMGMMLFGEKIRKSAPSLLYDFLERYILELSLIKDEVSKSKMLDEDNVQVAGQYQLIDSLCSFSYTWQEGYYTALMQKEGVTICKLRFPGNVQLIYGMNKRELEQTFWTWTKSVKATHTQQLRNISIEELDTIENEVYYIKQGEVYLLKEINSHTYYMRNKEGAFTPLYSKDKPAETIANLFNDLCNEPFLLQVRHKKYDKSGEIYTFPLQQLLNYCAQNQCTPYIGVEEVADQQTKATIIFENKELGFNHLLYIDVDRSTLAAKKGTIKGILYTYIPTDNIKTLYKETK